MKYPVVKLDEVCVKIISGGTPKADNPTYWEGTIPWITSADIQGYFTVLPRRFISENAVEKSAVTILPKGGVVVVTRVGLGKVALAETDLAFSQDVQGLILKPSIDGRYLVYALSNKVKRFKEIARGATIQGVTREDLANIKLPLPPLAEQQRIAALLDKADTLRQADRALLSHYDALTQSLFLDLFGDPVTNEKGWVVRKLGEVGTSRLGKMLDAKKQVGNKSFPYLGNSNVQWGRFKLENLSEMEFDEREQIELSLRSGDLLICEGGEVGRTAIWKSELKICYFQKALHRLRLKNDIAVPEYFYYLMWFFSKNGGFKDFVTVATIAHLTGEKLRIIPIPVPPLPLQQKFAQLVGHIEGQKAMAQQQAAQSEALFQSLLQLSFGG